MPGASDSHALPGHPPGVGVGHGHGHAGALPLPLAAPLPGVPSAADHKYLLELRAEANYYGLTGLMAAIDRYPHGLVRLARAAALNLEDSWMWVLGGVRVKRDHVVEAEEGRDGWDGRGGGKR